jgi:hypothetical protein
MDNILEAGTYRVISDNKEFILEVGIIHSMSKWIIQYDNDSIKPIEHIEINRYTTRGQRASRR